LSRAARAPTALRGVKALLRGAMYVALVVAASGCVPIGARVQNLFAG
jgi:hypothetical protein